LDSEDGWNSSLTHFFAAAELAKTPVAKTEVDASAMAATNFLYLCICKFPPS
jgi:hypothetical protein